MSLKTVFALVANLLRQQNYLCSATRSDTPFDKIHCNLWGPTPIVSYTNYKYYVSFVNDYTKFIWFYPLQTKSGFFTIFLYFVKLVDRQFSAKIKLSIFN